MSDYTQLTFFAPKDALASGNPSKLVKGTEIDAELAAIGTAIASKYDLADLATNVEAAALSSTSKLLTPASLKYAIENGLYSPSAGAKTKFKAADTNRSSTVAPADDPHLTVALAAGTYAIEAYLSFRAATGGTQGIQVQFGYTGTVAASGLAYQGAVDTGINFNTSDNLARYPFASLSTLVQYSNISTGGDYVHVVGFVEVSDSGTLSLKWSQRSSNAAATILARGSWLRITPAN